MSESSEVSEFVVEAVPAPRTFELRQRVLRPHQEPDDMAMPGDDDPDTGLYAAVDAGSGEVVSTANVRPEAPPDALAELAALAAPAEPLRSWRLRGMATRDDLRGQGLGTLVLDACIDHVANHGGGFLWCSARVPARALYERGGFVVEGDVYEVEHIGPHLLMWRTVEGSA